MRYALAIVAVVVLCAGYVLANDQSTDRGAASGLPRYQLADNGQRMLDATTGVLYALDGSRWSAAALAPEQAPRTVADSGRRRRLVEEMRETHRLILCAQELIEEGRALKSDEVVGNGRLLLDSMNHRLTAIEKELAE